MVNLKKLSKKQLVELRERTIKAVSIGIHDEDILEAINIELRRREKNE